MVTFCTKCGASLPLADITIKRGEEMTSQDYRCPLCGDFAASQASPQTPEEEIGEETLTIKDGKILKGTKRDEESTK